MAVTHTPVNLPNDVSAASMGANNIVIDGRTNSTTAETTLYACWDPSTEATSHGYSNHNLTITASSSGADSVFGNFYIDATDSDGYYWRCKLIGGVSNGYPFFGIHSSAPKNANWWNSDDNWSIGLGPGSNNGKKTHDQTQTALDPALSFSNGDYCDICLKNGKLYFGKNGTWSGDPDAESGEAFSSLTGMMTIFFAGYQSTSSLILDTVGGTAPSGAKRLTKTVTGFGNYATWNPLSDDGTGVALSDGNLNANRTGDNGTIQATLALPESGKWAWQSIIDEQDVAYHGIMGSDQFGAVFGGSTAGNAGYVACMIYHSSQGSELNKETTQISTGLTSFVAGDIIEILVDVDSATMDVKRNGSAHGSQITGITLQKPWIPFIGSGQQMDYGTTDFGQNGYTPSDSSYKTLHTGNFPTPSYTPSDYFNTVLYNGNGSDGNAITGVGFAADFIWIKDRENGMSHRLYDSIRGVNAALRSDTADPQDQLAGYGQLETTGGAFSGADGFTVGVGTNSDGTQGDGTNKSGEKHVAWCWKMGGAPTATNSGGINPTSGSRMKGGAAITTAYASANIYPVKMTTAAHGGSSIFTYTGTGTNGHTVPHGLDAAPSFVVIKDVTDSNQDAWQIGHVGMTSYDYTLAFNSADAQDNSANWWNDTAPSATLITLGDVARSNDSGETHVCYAFADIEGVQKFGVYAGNSTTSTPKEGPFVYLGFKPNLVIIKSLAAAAGGSGDGGHWHMFDNVRNPGNPSKLELNVNGAGAEGNPGNERIDFTANGFKIRDQYDCNGSGRNYVYAAFGATAFASNNRAK